MGEKDDGLELSLSLSLEVNQNQIMEEKKPHQQSDPIINHNRSSSLTDDLFHLLPGMASSSHTNEDDVYDFFTQPDQGADIDKTAEEISPITELNSTVPDLLPHQSNNEICNDNNNDDLEALSGGEGHNEEKNTTPNTKRKKASNANELKFEDLQKYFHLDENSAAGKMNIGRTTFKIRCRELNIKKWPMRKLESLKTVIDNVKEFGWTHEVPRLEEEHKTIFENPNMKCSEETEKLRRKCYKEKCKRKYHSEDNH